MGEILRQLEALALGAIPTLILFIVLVLAYRYVLFGALVKVRAQRRERTVGAMERAQQAIGAADARTQEYEAKLRMARAEIFRHREQLLKQRNAERESALAAARQAAQQRVHEAQAALERQAAEARNQIEVTVSQLAAQVLAAVLPSAAAEGSR
jgi:F-type H+-transporting ATPase subunit b